MWSKWPSRINLHGGIYLCVFLAAFVEHLHEKRGVWPHAKFIEVKPQVKLIEVCTEVINSDIQLQVKFGECSLKEILLKFSLM